jgi:transposase
VKKEEKFMSEIDLNKSSSTCSPCSQECEKINKRLNKRKIEEIDSKEVPHLLKVFDF